MTSPRRTTFALRRSRRGGFETRHISFGSQDEPPFESGSGDGAALSHRVRVGDHGRTHLHFHFVVFLYIPRFTARARWGRARGRTFFFFLRGWLCNGIRVADRRRLLGGPRCFWGQWRGKGEERDGNLFLTHNQPSDFAKATSNQPPARRPDRGRAAAYVHDTFRPHYTPTDALRIFFVYW